LFEDLKFLRSSISWDETSDAVRAKLKQDRYGAILVPDREMAAELLYYLRDLPVPLYVWPRGETPHHHYEMTRPFTAEAPEPVLFVSQRPCPASFSQNFSTVEVFAPVHVPLIEDETRALYMCRLEGFGDGTDKKE